MSALPHAPTSPSATIGRATLKDALARVRLAVGPAGRGNADLQVIVLADRVRLTAFDGTVGVTATFAAQVDPSLRQASWTVPHRDFAAAVRTGPEAVDLSPDGPDLQVTVGDRVVRLKDRSHLGVTSPPQVRGRQLVLPPTAVDVLGRVASAAASGGTRPVLEAVLVDGDRAVATDSYRLHVGQLPCDTGLHVLLPAAAVRHVAGWRGGQAVRATASDRLVELRGVDVRGPASARRHLDVAVVVPLTQGAYPKWRTLVPAVHEPSTVVPTADLRAVLADAAKALGKDAATRPVTLHAEAGRLRVACRSAGLQATVPADVDADAFAPVACNARYALDALDAVAAPAVALHVPDPLRPMLWTAAASPVQVVQMPMRT